MVNFQSSEKAYYFSLFASVLIAYIKEEIFRSLHSSIPEMLLICDTLNGFETFMALKKINFNTLALVNVNESNISLVRQEGGWDVCGRG